MKQQKPGVMLYFDLRPLLELLEPAEAGELIIAALDFAAGQPPQITSPRVAKTWPYVKPRIEADDRAYFEKSRQAECAVYARDNRGSTRAQWEALYPQDYQSLDERISAAAAPATPPEPEPPPEITGTTPPADDLAAAFQAWTAYRRLDGEQTEIMRRYFTRWVSDHGAAAVAAAVDAAISAGATTITFEDEDKEENA